LKASAARPPRVAPRLLDSKSTLLASRIGRNIWVDSIANESRAPAPIAVASRAAGPRRVPISATRKPNGAYASTLTTISKRVKYWGQDWNRKNGVSGNGAIQPEKGSRLA